MKKILLSFILMAAGFGMANAAEPVKGIVCSYAGQEAFFPLSDAPQVKYVDKAGVKHAVVLVGGVEKLSVALVSGGKLEVSYDSRVPEPDNTLVLDTKENNSETLTANLHKTADVKIKNLSITAGKWSTLCLPFDLTADQIATVFGAGTDIESLTGSTYDATENELSLSFTAETEVEAGKPYLIKVPADVAEPTFAGVTIAMASTGEMADTEFAYMKGSFVPVWLAAGDMNVWFISNNTFYYPSVAGQIAATKCWFSLQGAARQNPSKSPMRVRMFTRDDANAIFSISTSDKSNDGALYNMQGVRVSQPAKKGVYIRNGVKMIIK